MSTNFDVTTGRERFISLAIAKHGDVLDYTEVIFKNNTEKVTIICPVHGAFKQSPRVHLRSKNPCPRCAREMVAQKLSMTTREFIEKAVEVYGNKFDYSKAKYTRSNEKVIIICPIHGEFEQTPNGHLTSKFGCEQCAMEARGELHKLTTSEFIARAKLVHGDVYTYEHTVYGKNVFDPVIITCPKHGDVEVVPNKFIHAGRGCPRCGEEKGQGGSPPMSLEEFKVKAQLLHGDKYDYSQAVYTNSKTPVEILCPDHGSFYQQPNNHLSGSGCLTCSLQNTRPEKELYEFLSSLGVSFTVNDRTLIAPYELDFYLPDHKLAIEVNGVYWHSAKFKSKDYHWQKEKRCRDVGVNLLQFWDVEMGDLVLSMIAAKLGKLSRIGARKTKVVDLSPKEYKEFLSTNHLQGARNSKHKKGLVYKGELVSVMGISGNHIDRFASKQRYTVVGGFTKLLAAFDELPGELISFSANRYSDGSVYSGNSFKLVGETRYTLNYTDFSRIFPREKFQRHKLQDIRPEENVDDYLAARGIYALYGAGTRKWRLKVS